jgi:transcriptional antiterminator RfaH
MQYMHWYLVHTKPRQENVAQENLERQGYECYLPLLRVEKLRQRALVVTEEALFPRYLFILLGLDDSAKSWGPIRSTKGVSALVRFGHEPARVADALIALLKAREAGTREEGPEPLFHEGERLLVSEGPFAGIEGIYQMTDGEQRVMVLIDFLNKPVALSLLPASVRKAA